MSDTVNVYEGDHPNVAEVVRDLAYGQMAPVAVEPDGDPILFRDGNGNVQHFDPSSYTESPRRPLARRSTVLDPQSFIDLVAALGETIGTRVYANQHEPSVVAVLNDDDDAAEGGWRDRSVVLDLQYTPEWIAWRSHNDTLMPQHKFVQFLEDRMLDIRTPAAADLYEIAQTLEGTTGATFRSAIRLQSGARKFAYEENTDATAGRTGEMEIPEAFTVGLAVWMGPDAKVYEVTAKLRYSITSDGLKLGYHLLNVERLLDSAFRTDIVDPIKAEFPATVYGTP